MTGETFVAVLAGISEATPLSVAARQFATAGVPVFPCTAAGKRPATEHGFHDATTDPDRVGAWWDRHPDANIGIPTGQASGLVVVDVDVHGATNGFAAFERATYAGLVDGWAVTVGTPSGGLHAYYPATPGVVQSCWQAAKAGVDFRGDGGYIVAPPSRIAMEGLVVPYRVRTISHDPAAVLDAGRLRDFLDPRPALRSSTGHGQGRRADASRLAAWVAGRAEGERNAGLFWAACRLAENDVPVTDALDVLTVAASQAGLSDREITTTVRSAYRTAAPVTVSPRHAVPGRDWFVRPTAAGREPAGRVRGW